MPRLIDANRLNVYKAWVEVRTDDNAVVYSGKRKIVFADDIANAPTVDAVPLEDYQSMERTVNKLRMALADAVPVVRCEDCKWHEEGDCVWNDDEWFCADGERKEDAGKVQDS